MAAPPATIREGPPPLFVENVFFKSYTPLTLSIVGGEDLLQRSAYCLATSSKFGVLFVAGGKDLAVLRVDDILRAQIAAGQEHKKTAESSAVPQLTCRNGRIGQGPTLVTISNGEEFIAMDTIRDQVPFVLVFNLEQFIKQAGNVEPLAELRASGSKVSAISWNPGDAMSNILAINCDDGALQLVTLKGSSGVEMCSYKDVVRSMCWSPKGKQLVVGKSDGSLAQLKLDLSEAKRIPGPGGPNKIPSAIFWTSTTQFLINYVVEGKDIEFMQLDLAKVAPPAYSNFGDIFVSDRVSPTSKCQFVPLLAWNLLILPSNTINDVIVIGKGLGPSGPEAWSIADLNDNRRAALPIDNFAVGSALFTGYGENVVFSEAETYKSMPLMFVLSHTGSLSSFSIVNSKPDVQQLFTPVANPLPVQLFTKAPVATPPPISNPIQTPVPVAPAPSNKPLFNLPTTTPTFNIPPTTSTPTFSIMPIDNKSIFGASSDPTKPFPTFAGFGSANPLFGTTGTTPTLISNPISVTTTSAPIMSATTAKPITTSTSSAPTPAAPTSIFNLKSLPTSGLPSLPQVDELKRIVEEKRAQGGFQNVEPSPETVPDSAEDEPDMDMLLLEVDKFKKRLELFYKKKSDLDSKVTDKIVTARKRHEETIVKPLNLMEDFVATLDETCDMQKEEVNGLKEKIFSYYTQLEYAKALAERNRDPTYMQLLRAQAMDAGRAKKFHDVEKLYLYVKNQAAECERFYKIQRQQPQPLGGGAVVQGIYQTLSNHSKVLKKLHQDLNMIRGQLGQPRISEAEHNVRVFEVPVMGQNYFDVSRKPLLKERGPVSISKTSVPKIKSERITLDDITAGVSRLKLARLREAGLDNYTLPGAKPLRISVKKLEALTEAVSQTTEIELTAPVLSKDDDPFDLSARNRAKKTRSLINRLDDMALTNISVTKDLSDSFEKAESVQPVTTITSAPTLPISAPVPVIKPISPKIVEKPAPSSVSLSSIIGNTAPTIPFGFTKKEEPKVPNDELSLASLLTKPTTTPIPKASPTPIQPIGFNINTKTSFTPPKIEFGGFSFTSGDASKSIFSVPEPKPAATSDNVSKTGEVAADKKDTTKVSVSSVSSVTNITPTFLKPKPEVSNTEESKSQTISIFGQSVSPATSAFSFGQKTAVTVPSSTGGFTVIPPTPTTTATTQPTTQNPSFNASSIQASSPGDGFTFSSNALPFGATKPNPQNANSQPPSIFGSTTTTAQSSEQPPASIFSLSSTSSTAETINTFSFGPKTTAASSTGGFTLPSSSTTAVIAPTTQAPSFQFNVTSTQQAPLFGSTTTQNSQQQSLAFGLTSSANDKLTIASNEAGSTQVSKPEQTSTPFGISNSQPSLLFGSTTQSSQQPASIFGSSTTITTVPGGTSPTTTQPAKQASPFQFNSPSSETSSTGDGSNFGQQAPIFGSKTQDATNPQPAFGSVTQTSNSQPASIFGSTITTQNSQQPASIFGSSTTPATNAFAFGQTTATAPSSTPFSQTTTQPATQTPSFQFNSNPNQASSAAGGFSFSQPASAFGSLTQSTTNSPFGSNTLNSQPASIFGSTTIQNNSQQQSSAFGVSSPAPSLFGASPTAKPVFGSAPIFGGTPFGSTPAVFGSSSPAFGSGGVSSPFGASFGASPSSPVATGGSIFGGGAVQGNSPSFGALAQTAPASQFGAQGGSVFGGGSTFGGQTAFGASPATPVQQTPQGPQAAPVFGGSAFSSWR